MNQTWKNAEMTQLYQAVLSLKTIEECGAFFEDLCTIGELKAMAQRLEVAGMLKGQATYQDISEQTGASTATISRVNRALQYGEGGYDRVLARLADE